MSFPKSKRIKSAKEIEYILKTGEGASLPDFSLKFKKNKFGFTRVKVVVPVKVDKRASKRNLLRRRGSEILRKNIDKVKKGYDIILIFKKGALEMKFNELEENILQLFKKARLL